MARPLPPDVDRLIRYQAGIVRRGQLIDAGLPPSAIHRRLASGEWQRLGEGVYATFTGRQIREARLWTAVLLAGPGALLSHETAAELHGFAKGPSPIIHISVPAPRDPARSFAMRGVILHRCRVMRPDRVQAPWVLPRTGMASTAIDLIKVAETFDDAYSWVCRATKNQLIAPILLREELAMRGKMRWRTWLTEALSDAESGIDSALELRYVRDVERAHRLPSAQRQARQYADGKVMRLDNLYADYHLCVELDGAAYHPPEERQKDADRDNANIAATNTRTMRFDWVSATEKRCKTARLVAEALRNNGWKGMPRRCAKGCPVT
jgi:very-short-patch-repair endonuclease